MGADLVLRNGRFTTLDRSNPTATAVAITAGGYRRRLAIEAEPELAIKALDDGTELLVFDLP
jgi:hypothetical protein